MNTFIDHTLLKADATTTQIKQLCEEAIMYKFASVCVNPGHVELAKAVLEKSNIKVCTVIGFPLGATTTASKCFETEIALKQGAEEFDMVINVGWLKENNFSRIRAEINSIKEIVGDHILKVIVEISLLTKEELVNVSKLVSESNADFIKTSTGFGSHGATFEAVRLFKEHISAKTKIKASGGIRDYKTAKAYVDLGVSRIGTSSGVNIMKEIKTNRS